MVDKRGTNKKETLHGIALAAHNKPGPELILRGGPCSPFAPPFPPAPRPSAAPFPLITEVEAASNPRRHFICSLVILFPLATSVSTHSFSALPTFVSASPPPDSLSLSP